VTYFATIVFIFVLGVQHLDIVLGLVIGGVIAAPIGAFVASKVNPKALLILVGVLVIITSTWSLVNIFLKYVLTNLFTMKNSEKINFRQNDIKDLIVLYTICYKMRMQA